MLAAQLVADLASQTGSSIPDSYLRASPVQDTVRLGGDAYFTADDGSGPRLWRSDGTPGGTVRMSSVAPASPLFVSGSHLYFASGPNGGSLWTSDGSSRGTASLNVSIAPASYPQPPYWADVNGLLYFAGPGGLWKTDGTPAGTNLVKSLAFPDLQHNGPQLTNANGTLFFVASDGSHGFELWKSDGSGSGTVMVSDINAGAGNAYPLDLQNDGGTLLFSCLFRNVSTPATTTYLWKSDGTAAGTVPLTQIASVGSTVAGPIGLAAINGTGVFVTVDSAAQTSLWKTNGTAAGTSRLTQFSHVGSMLAFHGALYFDATDSTSGDELWRSDGTQSGTARLRDINPGAGSSSPNGFAVFNNTLYFAADDGTHGPELWKTDGTAQGTALAVDLLPGASGSRPQNLATNGRSLFFAADNGTNGKEMFVSDGTVAGTHLTRDINLIPASSTPASMQNVNGTLYFSAADASGREGLYRSDGTSAGTRFLQYVGGPFNLPRAFTPFAGEIFFSGVGLWKTDGTPAGTVLAVPQTKVSDIISMAVFENKLYFDGVGAGGAHLLWESDGTDAGTVQIPVGSLQGPDPNDLTPVGDNLFFTARDLGAQFDLYVLHNGTLTMLLAGSVDGLTAYNGRLYFFYAPDNDPTHLGLWTSDGTPAGTLQVAQGTFFPQIVAQYGGAMIFTGSSGTSPAIFRSDGTSAGTYPLALFPSRSTLDGFPTTAGDGVYFKVYPVYTAGGDTQLWKTDGTEAGTSMVADVPSPSGGYLISDLVPAPRGVYFSHADTAHGTELWYSDGTAAGTGVAADIVAGPASSNATPLVMLGNVLYFAANDPVHGTELWRFDPQAPAVVGRYVFYNNSRYDGGDPAANAADDNAIAPDKQALLPGRSATFANYTSYSKGINGIAIDLVGLRAAPGAGDFLFRVGNSNDPSSWAAAPEPLQIVVRPGAGFGGSDRVEVVWADGAVRNEWLQVTVKADASTGLATPDVFYFGNAVGAGGTSWSSAQVTNADELAARSDPHSFVNPADLWSAADYNRDGRVDAIDQIIARTAAAAITPALNLIQAPLSAAAGAQSEQNKGRVSARPRASHTR